MEIKPLPEVGNKFPYHLTKFETQKWKGKQERQITELVGDGTGRTFAEVVTAILAVLVVGIDGTKYNEAGFKERRGIWTMRHAADVLYAYVFCRYESMGKTFRFNTQCSFCTRSVQISADLSTLEVKVIPPGSDYTQEYTLQGDKVKLNDKTFDQIVVSPPTFEIAMAPVQTKNQVKLALLHNAAKLIGTNGTKPIPFSGPILDQLDKVDIEGIADVIEQVNFGPEAVINSTCPACSSEFVTLIDWSYAGFFLASLAN